MKYKLKYLTLDKEEINKLKIKFYNTKEGKIIKNRLDRLFVYGILGILFSIYLFISEPTTSHILVGVILLIVSLVYLGASFKLRHKELNNYYIKTKK